jgi:hypothetical protein
MARPRGQLTDKQWAIFRSRMEELANQKTDAPSSPVKGNYLAEVVLLLMDRLEDLEKRLSPSASPTTPVLRCGLAALTQEDWDAFLSEYGEYVMDGWGDLRAFRTALGTLLATLEEKEKQPKGGQKRA